MNYNTRIEKNSNTIEGSARPFEYEQTKVSKSYQLVFGNGSTTVVAKRENEEESCEFPLVVVIVPSALAVQHHHGSRPLSVTVNRQLRAGLQGVQDPLAPLAGRSAFVGLVRALAGG